jgi:hypothetical protein
MTDVMGRTPKFVDRLAMAFEWGTQGALRVGVIQSFDNTGRWPRVEMLWEKASIGGLPQSPITKVQLRNYVIIS